LILPHLSIPKRGPKCKLGYHREAVQRGAERLSDALEPIEHADSPSPEAPPESVEPAPTQRGTILLIDDEPGVQRALRRLLQRSGHEITTTANSREGLAALEARSYDVILCDLRMPDLDGPGLYRELARRHPHLLLRVIFLTGDMLSPEAQAFFSQVNRPRLEKPLKAQEVRRVIQQVLEARCPSSNSWEIGMRGLTGENAPTSAPPCGWLLWWIIDGMASGTLGRTRCCRQDAPVVFNHVLPCGEGGERRTAQDAA
jgi:CheY-like chemotaxis protein